MNKLPLWRKALMLFEALAIVAIGAYDLKLYSVRADELPLPPAVVAYDDLIPEAAAKALPVQSTSRDFAQYVRLSEDALRHADDPASFARLSAELDAQGARVQAGIRLLKATPDLQPEERALLSDFESGFLAYQSSCLAALELAPLHPGSLEAAALLNGQDQNASSPIAALSHKLRQRALARRMV
jgi:hypothetical protein